jgi:hypothetical protein
MLGALVGSRLRYERCSDPHCDVKLPPAITRCPRCGGEIAGTLARGENRLEDEERLKLNPEDYELPEEGLPQETEG